MKLKSFAWLTISILLPAFFVFAGSAYAEDSFDTANNSSGFQTLADNTPTQNQENNVDPSNMQGNNTTTNSPSNTDEGSPDMASATGDDDY